MKYPDDYIGQVIQGDCLEVMKDIPDGSIDLVVTDPPYNISQKSGGLRKLDFGEWDKDANNELVFSAIEEMVRVCKGTLLIFCANEQMSYIYNYLKSNNYITKVLLWLKPNPSVINCQHSYVIGQEHIIYAKNRGTIFNPKFKLSYFNYPFPHFRWHPTEKPLKLIKELILDCSKENDLILDPFLGSGTTAVAAQNLKRNFIGIELEPKYCEIARQRLRQGTLL